MTNLNNALLDALTTHKIAITEQTATLLLAVNAFENSIEKLASVISDNSQTLDFRERENGNTPTSDEVVTDFLSIVEPAENWLFRKVGFSLVKSLFFKSNESEFEGL